MTIVPDVAVGLHSASPLGGGAARYMDLAYGPSVTGRVTVHPEGLPEFGAFIAVDFRYMLYTQSKYYGRPTASEFDASIGSSWTFGTVVRHGPELSVGYFTSLVHQPDAYLGPRSETFHGLAINLGYSVAIASPLSVVLGAGTVVGHEDVSGPLYFGHVNLRFRFLSVF